MTSKGTTFPFGCETIFRSTQISFSFPSIVSTRTDRGSSEVELQPPRILNIGTKGLWLASRTGPYTPDEDHRLEPVWTLRKGENLLLLPTIASRSLGRFGHFTGWANPFHGNVPNIKEIIKKKTVILTRIGERLTTATTKSMTYELIYQLNAIEYLLCTFSSTCFGLTRPSSGAMDVKFLYIYSICCPWCS